MNISNPPTGTEAALSAYLTRVFKSIELVLNNIGKLPVNKQLAPKPVVGKLYYYSQALSDGGLIIIPGEGLYVYTSTGYKPCTN